MTAPRRQLGLAQLSLLNTAPPRLVAVAAEAGFDFIGARVRPVTASERPYDLQPGSPMLRETLARMADTGVAVRDIEFLLLDGTDQRDAWLAMMAAGQALGAASLTVAASDPDTARVAGFVKSYPFLFLRADDLTFLFKPGNHPVYRIHKVLSADFAFLFSGCKQRGLVADVGDVRS